MPRRLNHQVLLHDKAVKTWFEENALRSKHTAGVNLRRLGLFLHLNHQTPQGLLVLARNDPDKFHAMLVGYAKALQDRGRLPSYISKTFVGLRSWLSFNRIRFDQFPKLRVIQGASLGEERVPTQDELRRILSQYSPRSRVVALMMAHAGVRPGVLATVDASDGLRLSDLKDLRLTPAPKFGRLPFHLIVPARLSKTSVEYHTFGGPELGDAILGYLSDRASRGEAFTGASPLITVDPMGSGTALRERSNTGFITTAMMMRALRRGLKAVLPADRTYVFRSYASTQMLAARIDRDVREEILGHSLGVSGRYNLSKKLTAGMIDDLRREYERALPYLETGQRADPSRLRAEIRQLLDEIGAETGIPRDAALSSLDHALGRTNASQSRAAVPSDSGGLKDVPPRIVSEADALRLGLDGWVVTEQVGPSFFRIDRAQRLSSAP